METQTTDLSLNFTSRAFCSECDFLKSRCLCDVLKSVPNKIHLIVLQHPTETKHPLNTVRIMKKSFTEITVMIGEDFTNDHGLNTILHSPENQCALLYPQESSTLLSNHDSSKKLTHLLLIDGTWRKAKKMFILSKNLHDIPSIKLEPIEASDYRIRKAPSVDSLSTLEASVEAFRVIEPELNTDSLNLSFQKMVNFQIKKMGREVYFNNYLSKKN